MPAELPRLEAHQAHRLAQKGSDRITNAVALCPNCHQRSDRDAFTEAALRQSRKIGTGVNSCCHT
ncbi:MULTISPECIES: HNH endonuclease [Pseudomonas]|uniref:HNH endonuclease n=1 Tax=Pseudomonas reactans TaxID=117680 RepID=UPI00351BF94B